MSEVKQPEKKYMVRVRGKTAAQLRAADDKAKAQNPKILGKVIRVHEAKKAKSTASTKAPTAAPTASPTAASTAKDENYVLVELTKAELKALNPSDIIHSEPVTQVHHMIVPNKKIFSKRASTSIPTPAPVVTYGNGNWPATDVAAASVNAKSKPKKTPTPTTPVIDLDAQPGIHSPDPREVTDPVPGDLSLQPSAYTGRNTRLYILDNAINDSPEMTDLKTGQSRIDRSFPSFTGGNLLVDQVGHSSHTASDAAGNTHGIANDARVIQLQVMDGISGSNSNIIRGIYAAVDKELAYAQECQQNGWPYTIPVMNISLGLSAPGMPAGPIPDAIEFATAFKALSDAGFIVTLAASNNARDANSDWPSLVKDLPGFFVVENIAADGSLGLTSDYDKSPSGSVTHSEIGTRVATVGTNPDGSNKDIEMTGTSMSAPAIAGRVLQWVEYANANNLNRDALLDLMQKATMPLPAQGGWYTLIEPAGDVRKPMLLSPDAYFKRGYKQLQFDAPINQQSFPLLMHFQEFTNTMAEQTVGFTFHLDNLENGGFLRLALSSHRFIDGAKDFVYTKYISPDTEIKSYVDPSIQFATFDLQKITTSGDYWVQFRKTADGANGLQYFLEVGTGTVPSQNTRISSTPVPEDFVTANSFGFATVAYPGTNPAPLHVSNVSPIGQYMFLGAPAPQTVTVAPSGSAFDYRPKVTPSPSVSTTPPPSLKKNQCLSFVYKDSQLVFNVGKSQIEMNAPGGSLTVHVNGVPLTIGSLAIPPDGATIQIKRDANTGFALQVILKGKPVTLYKATGLSPSAAVGFLNVGSVPVQQTEFEKCLNQAVKGQQHRGLAAQEDGITLAAYAQHLATGAAGALSSFGSFVYSQLEASSSKPKEDTTSDYIPVIVMGVMASAAAALVLRQLWKQHHHASKSTVTTKAAPIIEYVITEDLEMPAPKKSDRSSPKDPRS